MDPLYTEDHIVINASPATIWNVLTNPKLTPKYMFGCTVVSDWKVGDEILWKGVRDGATYVKGTICELEPEAQFSFTTFDPNAEYEDIPENYLTATYTLSKSGDSTVLSIRQGDYETVAEGAKRYEDTVAQGGWQPVLEGIKVLAEQDN